MSDKEQSEKISEYFSSIPNNYKPIKNFDPPFTQKNVPQFHASEVWMNLTKIKTNKNTVPGDLPAKLIKEFAAYLADHFTDIINTSLKKGM